MTMLIKKIRTAEGVPDSRASAKGQEDQKSKTSSTKTNVPKWVIRI